MLAPAIFLRPAAITCAALLFATSTTRAAEPMRVVFQNGRSIQLSSLTMNGGKLVTTTAGDGFNQGQTIPPETIDHFYGDEPAGINSGIALLLMGKPAEAEKLLEPVLESQKITRSIPGNFWLAPARAALIAYALQGNTAKTTAIGKEISDATPEQGIDAFVRLGNALLLPSTTPVAEREKALSELINDDMPPDVCAYASFFRADLLSKQKHSGDLEEARKQDQEVLEAYLTVPCLYPTGGMVINGTAELKAAEILTAFGRREEALALLQSAIRQSNGTVVVGEANKRLESLK